jgi:hypothetical protein
VVGRVSIVVSPGRVMTSLPCSFACPQMAKVELRWAA